MTNEKKKEEEHLTGLLYLISLLYLNSTQFPTPQHNFFLMNSFLSCFTNNAGFSVT